MDFSAGPDSIPGGKIAFVIRHADQLDESKPMIDGLNQSGWTLQVFHRRENGSGMIVSAQRPRGQIPTPDPLRRLLETGTPPVNTKS